MLANSATTNSKPSLRLKAAAELELRRRRAERRAAYADDRPAFIREHVQIFNATNERWEPFHLWPAQEQVLDTLACERRIVVLKARQLGLTWLALAALLHDMVFGVATVGIFSRREEDSADLLYNRLRGMYERLPTFARVGSPVISNTTHFKLPNGSSARAFPTNGGRQYTFSHLLVDEADFQEDLPSLLTAVEPTIDAGGRLWLISSVDKSKPMSRFKAIYRAAVEGANAYAPVFLPWTARPERDAAWYEAQKADKLANTGSVDDLHQEYPATDTEALAPRSLDKRIASTWLEACYEKLPAIAPANAPALPGLTLWREPIQFRHYVIGSDPAEGNPTSDPSALSVRDAQSGECVAELAGRIEPSVLASYADTLGVYYNHAAIMPERNNHGHAFILWLHDNSRLLILDGHDGKPGWLSNSKGKALLYNEAADFYREHAKTQDPVLHSFATYQQLASIEGSSLRAPEGMHDDQADADALSIAGMTQAAVGGVIVRQARVKGRGA